MTEPSTPDRRPSPRPRRKTTETSEPIWPAEALQVIDVATVAADINDAVRTAIGVETLMELPDCLACDGTGKDNHGTAFESPSTLHFAGPYVTIADRRRQVCMWCGHVLLDVRLADDDPLSPWFDGPLVRVEDGVVTRVPWSWNDEELPPGVCCLADEESGKD